MNAANLVLRPALKTMTTLIAMAFITMGLSVVTSSTATAQESATQQSMASRWTSDRYEFRVRHWINKRRANNGMSALTTVACATRTANRWSAHLAETDAFYHQDMGNLLSKCSAYYAGETLGRGGISPYRLVTMWMESAPHKAVLLSANAKRIGIGAVVDSHGQWLTTANFVKL